MARRGGRFGEPNTRERSRDRGKAKAAEETADATDAYADPEKNWAEKPDSEPYDEALKLYPLLRKAYENKDEQSTAIEEYWAIYNAQPDANQTYSGNSQGYIPAVRDALNARTKRVLKQLFPVNNKHVEAVSSDGSNADVPLALLEHYIRKCDVKTIVRSSLIAGDVTGQWNLMLDWSKSSRKITKAVRRNPMMRLLHGESSDELDISNPLEEEESTTEEEIVEEMPEIIDFATEDLAVIPPTCNDLQRAKAVCVRVRMSKSRVQELVDEGVFILPDGTDIDAFMHPGREKPKHNPEKRQASDAGVKTEGTDKHVVIFVCHSKFSFEKGEPKELGIAYFAGPSEVLGIIKNPLWSGRIPIISEPVERVQGSFFGKSKIEPVKFLQWQLTDFWNMGQDSAMYSLLPIWAVDPLSNPQWQQLVMGLAAVWPVDPNKVKPLTSPQLWKDSAQICDLIKRQIWESLDVNELMMGRMPQGRKNNQLMGAMMQEQSVNITDHAARYEETVLNPLLEMMFELDQQYRTRELMVEQRGEIGYKAALKEIPVPQWGQRYEFRWVGTEFMLGTQRMQQQIAWMNVLKGVPPQLLNGRTLDVTPILESGTENLFGPELAPRILVDKRNQFTVPPQIEDEMLHNMMEVHVHEADNDMQHIQVHMRAAAINQDPAMLYKNHIQEHMMQLQKKREMSMPKPPGLPGAPGGGPGTVAPPGVAGAPRPGALPAQGRPAQNPPGAVSADQMADGAAMPRG